MLLKVKREVEEMVEVELPFCAQKSDTYYRIDESSYKRVTIYNGTYLKQYCVESLEGFNVPNNVYEYEKITEATFNNIYQNALSELYRQEFIKATTPASEQDVRAKLYDDQEVFLSENIIE